MEYGYYPEDDRGGKKGRGVLTPGKILSCLGVALVIVVYILIMFRIFIKEDPKDVKRFIWTEEAVQAYEESGELSVQCQQIQSFSFTDDDGTTYKYTYNTITSDGCFQISNFLYIEATKQVVVTLRYNKVSLEIVRDNSKLTLPANDPYVFALSVAGADTENDEAGLIKEYRYTSASRFTYYYKRLVFDNVELPEGSGGVGGTITLNIYNKDDVSYDSPRASLDIYDSLVPTKYYDIKDALPAKTEEGLLDSPYVIENN